MAPSKQTSNKRVIVIDDDAGFRTLLSQMLAGLGYAVSPIAKFSLESVSVIRSSDIIFLDLRMPGMSGLEVLDMLALNRFDCPIIVMGGDPLDVANAEKKAQELGLQLVGVLNKPFRLPDVMTILQEA